MGRSRKGVVKMLTSEPNPSPILNFKKIDAKSTPSSDLTVVFLHNGGTDHSIWLDTAEIVSAEYPCVLIDWPGYGINRTNVDGFGFPEYAKVLDTFLQQLDLKEVVLVGHCMGSGISLEYCGNKKGQGIQAMVLFNVLVPSTLNTMGRLLYRWANSSYKNSYHGVKNRLRTPKAFAKISVAYQLLHGMLVSEAQIDHLKKLSMDPANTRNLGSLVAGLSKSEYLNELEKPDSFPNTYIYWSSKNRVLPLRKGLQFIKRFKPNHHQVIEGGHLVMLEQPKTCAELILNAIAESSIQPENIEKIAVSA